jgi:hypothetical protein
LLFAIAAGTSKSISLPVSNPIYIASLAPICCARSRMLEATLPLDDEDRPMAQWL